LPAISALVCENGERKVKQSVGSPSELGYALLQMICLDRVTRVVISLENLPTHDPNR